MRVYLVFILTLACVFTLGSGAIESLEPKLITKLTSVNDPSYSSYEDGDKDLTASASDRTLHISKEYGQPGVYGGSGLYGTNLGLGSSIYGPGTVYRGTGWSPGYQNPGYKGYPVGGPNGIIGGGQIGYGYYGNTGSNPGYGGYSGYGGYGNYGLGGYGGYGNGYAPGGYGSSVYDDGYYGGRGGYGRYGLDGYGSGVGYNGYGGPNYGSSYNTRSNYDPYTYRSSSYGSYASYPSGYRGYS